MALVEAFLEPRRARRRARPSARNGRRCRLASISIANGVTSPLDSIMTCGSGVLDVLATRSRDRAAPSRPSSDERHRQRRPQRVLLEQSIVCGIDPFELLIVVNVEAVAGLREHADRSRGSASAIPRAAGRSCCAVGRSLARSRGRCRERASDRRTAPREQADDRDDHEQLEQRKSGGWPTRAARRL